MNQWKALISKAKKTGKIKTGILRKLSIGFDRLSLSIEKERDRERKREKERLSLSIGKVYR